MALNKKGLGRGLSALIPDAEMDALSDITREGRLLAESSVAPNKKADFLAAGERRKAVETTPIDKRAKSPGVSLRQKAKEEEGETLQEAGRETAKKSESKAEEGSKNSLMIPIDAMVPNPFQPRRTFGEEELEELATSIRLHGILQPVLVRPAPSSHAGQYQLVAGERRWRAAQKAGLRQIPVILRPMTDQQALELALIENVQRHDISAIDAAVAYQRLANEFALSQEQIARRVGKSRSAVANTMRLLDLPEEARKAIESGAMSEGHGRAILLAGGEGSRRALLRRVLRDKLSVRETENLARSLSAGNIAERAGEGKSLGKTRTVDEGAWTKAERDCAKKLGARVKIKASNRRSTILIECGDADGLQRVLALLQ